MMAKSTSSPRKRKSTGKRLRFSVFQRDNFTCQYCGAQPPGVMLVCDHIEPVARGGETTIDNLITSCETCNQGKADRSLGDRPVRPDADLMYLETQQEIAELKNYLAAAQQRDDLMNEISLRIEDVWAKHSGLDWVPSDSIIRGLLQKYDVEVVEEAIRDVAVKVGTGYLKTYGHKWVGYLYAVARNLAADDAEGE